MKVKSQTLSEGRVRCGAVEEGSLLNGDRPAWAAHDGWPSWQTESFCQWSGAPPWASWWGADQVQGQSESGKRQGLHCAGRGEGDASSAPVCSGPSCDDVSHGGAASAALALCRALCVPWAQTLAPASGDRHGRCRISPSGRGPASRSPYRLVPPRGMDATVFDTGQSALCFERDSAQQSDPTNTLQLQGQGPEGPISPNCGPARSIVNRYQLPASFRVSRLIPPCHGRWTPPSPTMIDEPWPGTNSSRTGRWHIVRRKPSRWACGARHWTMDAIVTILRNLSRHSKPGRQIASILCVGDDIGKPKTRSLAINLGYHSLTPCEVPTRQLDAKTCLPYICRLTTHDEYARCCLWPTTGQLSSVAAVGDSWRCICSLFELPAHPARIVRTASHVSRGLPAPMLVDVPSSLRPTDSSHRLWPPRKLLGSQGLQPLDGLQAGPRDRVGAPTYECRHATVGSQYHQDEGYGFDLSDAPEQSIVKGNVDDPL
ncbi:hypothetical protein ACCO45_003854 [Purpureocillium lilacinum]|uniref:Uncharacterized protein n=1 Tax=Purpureocillium lilacinum TaxID=33203 RepID=A0ACC4E1H3_PURLI